MSNKMKNIFILPTQDKSHLFEWDGKLELGDYGFNYIENDESECVNRHIYITSDNSVKKGDFYYYILLNRIERANTKISNDVTIKKIILTTDPKLINEGIQPIPDDFINWFISNPC